MFENILVLAPHTDDGELGCGAALARFIEEGKKVTYVAFSTCEESVPDGFPKNILETEVKKATKIIGIDPENLRILDYRVRWFPDSRQEILEDLTVIKKEINPDLVFLPSSFDIHQDHKTINNEGIRAFKKSSILGYEFIWNNFSFTSNLFIPVEERHIERKIEAILAYQSQQSRFYSADKLIKGLANFRGLQISREYAEAFEVLRWIV
jgi:LmbE family N-acetylglucosaminyl deacetylase